MSATGHGEVFIRYTVAKEICSRVEHGKRLGDTFAVCEGYHVRALVALAPDGQAPIRVLRRDPGKCLQQKIEAFLKAHMP